MTQHNDIFHDTLKRYFGYDSFRSIQLDIVKSIAKGHDTLGLMPTGGGKSITFQVPALTMEGVCIVVTPLIALMKDQVMHLKKKGIHAEAIYSGQTKAEIQRILDNTIYGAVKFLYVSPERLSNPLFTAKLYYMKVCFFTVDEAHCISQWGYDFRPSYLKIHEVRELKPEAPILALTATATSDVVKDIQKQLHFGEYSEKKPNVFEMSFRRSNLSYVVRNTINIESEMLHILRSVTGSAIIYTRNRQKTQTIAKYLEQNFLSSTYYHAGLDRETKDENQTLWQNNLKRIMVATNAFGMGIDKPDVRIVIHIDCPDSLEEYFQEAGRAGRDGKLAYCVLLVNKSTHASLMRRIPVAFPEKDYIRKVYDQLGYFFQIAVESGENIRKEFNVQLFCQRFHHHENTLMPALDILQNAGYIYFDAEPETKPRVKIAIHRDELYYVNGLSELEDNLLTTLLRYHGNLFVDLTYIDTHFIAEKCHTKKELIHIALKGLAQRGIIQYIPERNVPLLVFVRQRIDSKYIYINKDVYEDLRDRLTERINSVVAYIENTEKCRQLFLINYFGEKSDEDCGKCDICLDNNPQHNNDRLMQKTEERIRALYADGRQHQMSELLALNIPTDILHAVVEKLRNEDFF